MQLDELLPSILLCRFKLQPSPAAMPFNVWHSEGDLLLERGQAQQAAEALPPLPGAAAAALRDAQSVIPAPASAAAAPAVPLAVPPPAFADKQALTESLLAAMATMVSGFELLDAASR
jgi:hypothetical protein